MKIRIGELLVSNSGHYYRVVHYERDAVSLVRVDGYTLFSCKPPFVESAFRPVSSSETASIEH